MAANTKRKGFLRRGMIIAKTFIFQMLLYKADGLLDAPSQMVSLVRSGLVKLRRNKGISHFSKEVIGNTLLLLEMLAAYTKGRYRSISRKKIALIAASILYFIMPVDIIPDFIPVVGLLDDVSLLFWLFKTLNYELEQYKIWRKLQDDDVTYKELYNFAKRKGIEGRSTLTKDELAKAIQKEN